MLRMNWMKLGILSGKDNFMKICFALLMILAVSGIVCAADGPNTPPVPTGHRQMSPPAGSESAGPGHERMTQERGEIRERFAQRHEEYIKWLEKNYPDDAKELAQIKKDDPELYLRRLKESLDKYGKLAYAEKTNPELAKILRQDVALKTQEENLLGQIRAATDEKQKQKLTDELRQLESKRFDLIVATRQIKYQELNKKLEGIKKELQKQQTDLDNLKSHKNEELKKRLDDLINQTEEINWD